MSPIAFPLVVCDAIYVIFIYCKSMKNMFQIYNFFVFNVLVFCCELFAAMVYLFNGIRFNVTIFCFTNSKLLINLTFF